MVELIYDELRPAGTAPIQVLARVRVLSTEEGGKQRPFAGRYRPNHNFGGPENRHFFIGQIEVPEKEWVHPGETRDLFITFLNVVGLREQLTAGRVWRIQEGSQLVATAELLSIVNIPDPSRQRICRRCRQWFEPEEGSLQTPEVTGPLGALQSVRAAAGDSSVLRFQCHRCTTVRRRTQIALWSALASLAVLILLLERFGILR